MAAMSSNAAPSTAPEGTMAALRPHRSAPAAAGITSAKLMADIKENMNPVEAAHRHSFLKSTHVARKPTVSLRCVFMRNSNVNRTLLSCYGSDEFLGTSAQPSFSLITMLTRCLDPEGHV